MKNIFKIAAFGLLLVAFASCEKHDPFDENTITGAVGPETYWIVESSMVKAGTSMGFEAQYYSTVGKIDHSEVWYDLFEKEDKLVSAALIKGVSYSVTSSITAQKRILQTIQSYEHSENLWDTLRRAYVLKDAFPVSYTLAPTAWVQPKDTNNFTKNLKAYFGENFATEFKEGLTAKMNSGDERNYDAYTSAFGTLGLLADSVIEPNTGKKIPYMTWITDSVFNVNSNQFEKCFKKNDSIWSKTQFDTLGSRVVDTFKTKFNYETESMDTTWFTMTVYETRPKLQSTVHVYPQILARIDKAWQDSVTFLDIISGAEGYSIEYQKSYIINAELRVYDDKGTYSRTDATEIAIN